MSSVSGDHEALGVLAALGLLLVPQIAFVAGGLALLRADRRRGSGVPSCEELDVMRRRSAVALGAGGLTVASAVAVITFAVEALVLAGLEFAAVLAGFSLLGRPLALGKVTPR